MTQPETVISVEHLSKTYGSRTAVDDISFDVRRGEAVTILGPNGAGKTTTISLLLGLRPHNQGTIRVFGDAPLTAQARRRIGLTQQSSGLPPIPTVSELLAYVAALHGDRVTVDELLQRFALTDLARRQTGGLSGGEQRRVAVALAFAGNPELVILDEPTTGLDVESRNALWDSVKAAQAKGTTILLTTHYMQEAEAIADRAIVMARGKIIADAEMTSIRSGIGARRVSFTSDALDIALPGATISGNRYSIITPDPDSTVRELVERNVLYRDLEVSVPSLEDAFLTLVGRSS